MAIEISEYQKKVVDAILDYEQKVGSAPTWSTLNALLGGKSTPGSVVSILRKRGILAKDSLHIISADYVEEQAAEPYGGNRFSEEEKKYMKDLWLDDWATSAIARLMSQQFGRTVGTNAVDYWVKKWEKEEPQPKTVEIPETQVPVVEEAVTEEPTSPIQLVETPAYIVKEDVTDRLLDRAIEALTNQEMLKRELAETQKHLTEAKELVTLYEKENEELRKGQLTEEEKQAILAHLYQVGGGKTDDRISRLLAS